MIFWPGLTAFQDASGLHLPGGNLAVFTKGQGRGSCPVNRLRLQLPQPLYRAAGHRKNRLEVLCHQCRLERRDLGYCDLVVR